MVIRRSRRRRTSTARRNYSPMPIRRRSSFVKKLLTSTSKTDFRLEIESRVARDIWAVIYITLSILTFLSLTGGIGTFGEWWRASFEGLFGIGINFVPAVPFIVGIVMLTSAKIEFNFTRIFGIFLLIAAALGVVHLAAPREEMLSHASEYGG
ncbi:hypothetical protein KKF38_00565, partial [Patescibacteria group bacterium]|nr:hypothetical protein [Patescibacteria group bacterium]